MRDKCRYIMIYEYYMACAVYVSFSSLIYNIFHKTILDIIIMINLEDFICAYIYYIVFMHNNLLN